MVSLVTNCTQWDRMLFFWEGGHFFTPVQPPKTCLVRVSRRLSLDVKFARHARREGEDISLLSPSNQTFSLELMRESWK